MLAALEEEKRNTPPAKPRFEELSLRIEEIASRIFSDSARQTHLRRSVSVEDAPELPTIARVRRPVGAVLDEEIKGQPTRLAA